MNRHGKKKRFISYHLSQFIAEKVKTIKPEQYDMLDNEDRDLIKKIGYASLEEKLWILGKLGSRFAIVVFDRKKSLEEKTFTTRLYKMLLLLRRKLSLTIGNTLSAFGIFVLGDEVIMKALSAVSAVLNHKTYYIIRDYQKLAENMDRAEDVVVEAEVSKQAKKTIDKFVIGILMGTDTISKIARKNAFNINVTQLSVMMYLSINDDRLVTEEEIAQYFSGNQVSIMKNIKVLMSLGYLERYNLDDKTHYVITGLGEVTMSRMRNYLINKTR